MAYKPIAVDRANLTIMGVPFPDLETLEGAAAAIGSQMFEGYEPTPGSLTIFRDLMLKKITPAQFVQTIKVGLYA
jgi:putative transcriptional regulator